MDNAEGRPVAILSRNRVIGYLWYLIQLQKSHRPIGYSCL